MPPPDAWPLVRSEVRPWTPRISPDLVAASVRRRHSGAYRAAVVPRIADRPIALPMAVLAATEEASAEVARFDAELGAEGAPFEAVGSGSVGSGSTKGEPSRHRGPLAQFSIAVTDDALVQPVEVR